MELFTSLLISQEREWIWPAVASHVDSNGDFITLVLLSGTVLCTPSSRLLLLTLMMLANDFTDIVLVSPNGGDRPNGATTAE